MMKIGIDWDDTFAPFNSIACKLASKKFGISPELTIADIESWGNTGRASVIKEYYSKDELYAAQTKAVPKQNIAAIRRLMEIADVYFISACYPQFMTTRARQIKEVLPEFPDRNIILGAAKDLVQFDVILDDNINNVLNSLAEFPVLMRKPWNKEMTGLLSVNNLEEFVALVEHILYVSTNRKLEVKVPTVFALVGPTGSKKNEIAEYATNHFFWERPTSYTTNPLKHTYVPESDFKDEDYFESTMYAGYKYGTKIDEIERLLKTFNVILPLDMCGAIGMKKLFPTVIAYVDVPKENSVADILRRGYSEREKVLRILSLETERKNKALADVVIDGKGGIENAVDQIFKIVEENQ